MNARGLADLKREEEEKGKGNELFAGGLDGRGGGSGLNVLGPPGGGGGQPAGVFDGLMGQAVSASDAATRGGPAERLARITLYSNGFQVDDGPLRDPASPENEQFLRALMSGKVPAELQAQGSEVEVDLVDKRAETYEAPLPPSYIAFSGAGNSLSPSAGADSSGRFSPDDIPDGEPQVDLTADTTTLQVRLSTGKKVRMTLNKTSTVQDILRLIKANGGAAGPFQLSAGYPPKAITDASQSVADAGLVGESITQS